MLKHTLDPRQIPRGKSLDYFIDLGTEMRNKGQLALTIDMDRLPKKDLSFLTNFQHLKRLIIRGGTQNQLKKITLVNQVKDICLISCKVDNYDFLNDFDSLEVLDIRLGSAKDYSSIGDLSKLKAINLMKLRNLDDITFITKLKMLQFIRLDSCSNVGMIPNLKNLTELKRVEIETMKRLIHLCGISEAPNIKELIVLSPDSKIEPNDFKCFVGHGTLQNILPGIAATNSKKIEEVNTLLEGQLLSSSDYIGGKYEFFQIEGE